MLPALALWIVCLLPSVPASAQDEPADGPAAEQQRQIAEWRELLGSPEADRRSFGATALLQHGAPEAIEALREALRNGPDDARVSILRAIAIPGDRRFLPDAMALLESDSERVRQSAIVALKTMRDADSIEKMAEYVGNPDAPLGARMRMCGVLAEARSLSAVPALIDLLDSPDPRLGSAAHKALEQITVMALPPDAEAWREWWQANRSRPREANLEDIIRRQHERIRALEGRVETLLVERFAARQPNRNGQDVNEALKSEFAGLRRMAVEAVAKEKLEALAPEIPAMLNDPEATVRAEAAKALAELDAQDAVPALIATLSDPSQQVQAEAARALGRLRAVAAVPELANSLSKPGVARAAAEALGRIGDPSAVPKLADLLTRRNNHPETRSAAASALGQLGDRRALDALKGAMEDEHVRWFAIDAVGSLGSAIGDNPLVEAVPPLVKYLLGDPKPDVREAAAVALGKMGAPEALEGLARGFDDSESRVREQAARAFERAAGQNMEHYEKHIAQAMEDTRYLRAARLNALAAERFARSEPEAAQAFRRARAACLRLAEDWPAARSAYDGLLRDAPPEAALYEEAASVLRALGGNHDEGMLALCAKAVQALPEQRERWWGAAADALERLAERGAILAVVAAADGFAREHPNLGESAEGARLLEQRAAAVGALREGGADVADERVKRLVASLGENPARRDAFVALLAGELGDAATEPLAEHGLAHESDAVRRAAIEALEKITGRGFGIEADASSEQVAAAIEKWLAERHEGRDEPPETAPDEGPAPEDAEGGN